MTKIWMILISLTLFAFLIGWFELLSTVIVVILLLSTFFKGQLVIDYFMDLKDVSLKYRLIPTIWFFSIITLIAIAYFS